MVAVVPGKLPLALKSRTPRHVPRAAVEGRQEHRPCHGPRRHAPRDPLHQRDHPVAVGHGIAGQVFQRVVQHHGQHLCRTSQPFRRGDKVLQRPVEIRQRGAGAQLMRCGGAVGLGPGQQQRQGLERRRPPRQQRIGQHRLDRQLAQGFKARCVAGASPSPPMPTAPMSSAGPSTCQRNRAGPG